MWPLTKINQYECGKENALKFLQSTPTKEEIECYWCCACVDEELTSPEYARGVKDVLREYR